MADRSPLTAKESRKIFSNPCLVAVSMTFLKTRGTSLTENRSAEVASKKSSCDSSVTCIATVNSILASVGNILSHQPHGRCHEGVSAGSTDLRTSGPQKRGYARLALVRYTKEHYRKAAFHLCAGAARSPFSLCRRPSSAPPIRATTATSS